MGKPSWVCTVITQVSLCLSLYIALNLGQPQNTVKRNGNTPLDLYFISVKGGFRPIESQFDLLKQMEKVAQTYKVSFVVSSSELGEHDPLMQNATQKFPSLRLPWYTTCSSRDSKEQEVGCFKEKITISNGKTLDIIGVDTELLHESALRKPVNGSRKTQLHWLINSLETSTSDWYDDFQKCLDFVSIHTLENSIFVFIPALNVVYTTTVVILIVDELLMPFYDFRRVIIGHQPLLVCEEKKEQMEKQEAFSYLHHHIFLKFEVNVYLSGQDCTSHVNEGNVAYIGNPSPNPKEQYSVFLRGSSFFSRELANGFLLHRISSQQIVTYYFTSAGEVAYKTVLQQKRRDFM